MVRATTTPRDAIQDCQCMSQSLSAGFLARVVPPFPNSLPPTQHKHRHAHHTHKHTPSTTHDALAPRSHCPACRAKQASKSFPSRLSPSLPSHPKKHSHLSHHHQPIMTATTSHQVRARVLVVCVWVWAWGLVYIQRKRMGSLRFPPRRRTTHDVPAHPSLPSLPPTSPPHSLPPPTPSSASPSYVFMCVCVCVCVCVCLSCVYLILWVVFVPSGLRAFLPFFILGEAGREEGREGGREGGREEG